MTGSADPWVLMNTNYGPVILELYHEVVPATVTNFLSYVDAGFYDSTLFHRVIDNFVVQGGGMSSSFQMKATSSPIPLETNLGLSNERGTIAMARTNLANSATSQFYFNTVDNPGLDYQSASKPGYAVFGHVIYGMDVVDTISDVVTVTANVNGAVFEDFPYPYPSAVELFFAERFSLSSSVVPTNAAMIDDESGVVVASYAGNRMNYGVVFKEDEGLLDITLLDGAHSTERLTGVDRLKFDDVGLAFDLNGSAGHTARLVNAALGWKYLTPEIAGLGLSLFDQGMSMESVAELAVQTDLFLSMTGANDSSSFVNLVYKNVVGVTPDAETLTSLQGVLDRGEMTRGQMLSMAASHELSQTAVEMVGISHTGVMFV